MTSCQVLHAVSQIWKKHVQKPTKLQVDGFDIEYGINLTCETGFFHSFTRASHYLFFIWGGGWRDVSKHWIFLSGSTVYTRLEVRLAYKSEVLSEINFGEFIDVTPISRYHYLPDQTMDRFPFCRHYAMLCCKYFEDFDLAQKCAKQDRMYRDEKIKIE